MTIFAGKISGQFKELTVAARTDSFTLNSLVLASGKAQLSYAPMEKSKVKAWVQTSSGNLYPELQNYHVIQNGADFDIIEQYGDSFIRFDAAHLSSTMPTVNSTLTVLYDYKIEGTAVITDPNLVADAVWNRQRTAHSISGSMGEAMTVLIGLVEDIPGDVWSSLLGSHDQPGTFGSLLNDLIAVSTPSAIATAVWGASINGVAARSIIEFIYDVSGGRWKLDTATNQMILYKKDNNSEIARFNLFGADGSGTVASVFERRRSS